MGLLNVIPLNYGAQSLARVTGGRPQASAQMSRNVEAFSLKRIKYALTDLTIDEIVARRVFTHPVAAACSASRRGAAQRKTASLVYVDIDRPSPSHPPVAPNLTAP